ncbi:MAG: metallophosphoesterase [Pseudomonadota bacterium]
MWNARKRKAHTVRKSRPSIGEAVRVYAVGDIHGRFDLMIELLGIICVDADSKADNRSTQIVFLGDYVDRGDETAQVLTALQSLDKPAVGGITFLRGNHEDALLTFLADPVSGRRWLDFGADQTLASYGVDLPPRNPTNNDLRQTRDKLRAAMHDHVAFLGAMPFNKWYGNVLFTHAGCNASAKDVELDVKAMMWGHPSALIDEPVPGALVVHGHYDSVEPVNCRGRICVDTGAYYSGRLTAVRLDQDVTFLSTGMRPSRSVE